ncbi:lipase 3-like isoform X2 [Oratosquilla oratoria]|uniref:lipase 3-like isoform X2 n=1 Tax=Oratosquilla oratoria TaxID=337810 RepID=UPI003F76358F
MDTYTEHHSHPLLAVHQTSVQRMPSASSRTRPQQERGSSLCDSFRFQWVVLLMAVLAMLEQSPVAAQRGGLRLSISVGRVRNTSTSSAKGSRTSSDLNKSTPELIRSRGYPVEVHRVVTPDGYILELHRIPGPRLRQPDNTTPSPAPSPASPSPPGIEFPLLTIFNAITGGGKGHRKRRRRRELPFSRRRRRRAGREPDVFPEYGVPGDYGTMDYGDTQKGGGLLMGYRPQRVALLGHGILCSSADFVMNDPDQALAFVLADGGYDVWLGNFRGNIYSRSHIRLDPEKTNFWKFSLDEIGIYDLPALVQYVLDQTGQSDLYYVGHSMGTTAFFIMMHYFPHFNQKIRAMAALAPVAYVHHQRGPFTAFVKPLLKFTGLYETLRRGELSGESKVFDSLIANLCHSMTLARIVCLNLLFAIAGPNSELVDKEYLPVILAHTPSSTSLRAVTHYAQLNAAKRFGAFDYGRRINRRRYGSDRPPTYALGRVTAPVATFWSVNDWVADYKDSIRISAELGNLVFSHRVTVDEFNHMDFVWAESASALVYSHVLEFLARY